jgi:PDZ domain
MIFASVFALSLKFSQPLDVAPRSTLTLAPSASKLPRRGAIGGPFAPVPPETATKYSLKAGEGLLALDPLPGSTGAKAGIRSGDILMSINGTVIGPGKVAPLVRDLETGKIVKFSILRDGKTVNLSTILAEKARDPGNKNYEVIYSDVMSYGKRMRTIITKPKSPGKHPALFFIQGFSPVSYDYTLETATGDVATIDGPILNDFANSGFVTMRVEKPGVGDSEGGPFADLDYTTELDIYRQALNS